MFRLLILFLFLSCASYGLDDSSTQGIAEGWDAKAWGNFETYPLGGLLYSSVGYGKKLWTFSPDEGAPDFWQYGYTRIGGEFDTSVVTNRLGVDIEFFPISIFGLSAGQGFDSRNYDKFSGIDCNKYMCDRSMQYRFVRAQLVGGYKKFALIASERYDWYRSPSQTEEFYDYMSYLVGRNGSDELRSFTILALYRAEPDLSFGALAWFQNMIFSRSNNAAMYAVVSYTQRPWQAVIGFGSYHSDIEAAHFSAIFSVRYTFKKSIALID